MSRRRPCLLPLALGLAFGLGPACGDGTSLDRSDGTSSGGPASSSEPSLPPGTSTGEPTGPVCDDACEPRLVLTWAHEGLGGEQAVAAMARDEHGSIVVGTRRGAGGFSLSKLSAEGQPQWEVVPQLPCVGCALVDLAPLPGGDVMLSVTAPAVDQPAAAVLARFAGDGHGLVWVRSHLLGAGPSSTFVRAGEVAILDEDRIVQLRVSGYSEGEVIVLQEVDGDGGTRLARNLAAQPGTGQPWPLLVVAGPFGDLLTSVAEWNEAGLLVASTARMLPPSYGVISHVDLPRVLDDLAVDGRGRRLELGRSDGDETVTLLLTSREAADPEQWSASLPLVSTSSTRAALAIGPDDDVYVAARTTPRAAGDEFFVVELAVARWSAQGELRWQDSMPLDMLATDEPVRIVVDDDDGIVVGTVIDGRLLVARYEQGCDCG